MIGFLNHLKYSVRALLRNPIFALVASLTLAVGVGANTALLSAGKAVLLRRFPFPDADRLVVVWAKHSSNPVMSEVEASVPDFLYWRKSNHTFEGMTAFAWPEC